MRTAIRFLLLVRAGLSAPPGGPDLTFDGAALLFDGVPLTFQSS